MTPKLLLIGGGGHCRSVLDCVSALREYAEVGIAAREAANMRELAADPNLAAPLVGTDAQLADLRGVPFVLRFERQNSTGQQNHKV